MVYLWAVLLLIGNCLAWVSTAFALPGNWLIAAFPALYAYLLPAGSQPRVSWTVVGVLLGLAILGEVLEFIAGAAGAAKQVRRELSWLSRAHSSAAWQERLCCRPFPSLAL